MPQAGAPAQLNVIYAGYNFNDTNGILIDRADDIAESYHAGEYTFDFTLRVTSPSNSGAVATDVANDIATFRTLLTALVAACRVPRGRLQIQYGGTTVFDWNPALGTNPVLSAFHTRARLEPLTSDDDSLMSKRFRLTLTFDHPATLSGQDGRQDSETSYQVTIRGRRVAPITATYTALNANSALAQYQQGTTDTWFQAQLPTPVAGGEWELADTVLKWDDEGGAGGGGRVLTVTRIYFEAVNGLREFTITRATTTSQSLSVTLSGVYIPTSTLTAKAAHDADASTFITNTLGALYPGVTFDAKPVSSQEQKTTVDGTYPWSVTFEQIVWPQSPSATDDQNVVTFNLKVNLSTPFEANTIIPGTKPQALQVATALYTAAIDVNSSGGAPSNLLNLWNGKFRQHCINALKGQLGASNLVVRLQDLGFDLTTNQIMAQVACIAWNSNVISLLLSEQIDETPAGNPVPMAVSQTAHEYFLFKGVARRVLTRVATCEYIVGTFEPTFWSPGALASGYSFVDVGWNSWEEARDAVNNGTFKLNGKNGGWYPLKKTPVRVPKTMGDKGGLSTLTAGFVEVWLFMSKLNTGPSSSPGSSSTRNTAGALS